MLISNCSLFETSNIMSSNTLFILVCIAEKFRFSAEFIEMRRQALDVFVNRIASHHELRQSEDLRTFLQAEEEVIPLTSVNYFVLCASLSILYMICWLFCSFFLFFNFYHGAVSLHCF